MKRSQFPADTDIIDPNMSKMLIYSVPLQLTNQLHSRYKMLPHRFNSQDCLKMPGNQGMLSLLFRRLRPDKSSFNDEAISRSNMPTIPESDI